MIGKHEFKAGDRVICTWGTQKGEKFIIVKPIPLKGYTCRKEGDSNKYYCYNERTLIKADDND